MATARSKTAISRPAAKPKSRTAVRRHVGPVAGATRNVAARSAKSPASNSMKRPQMRQAGDGRREGVMSPMASTRKMPGARNSNAEGARGPMARKLPAIKRPARVAVNPGGLAGFAKGVSDNFRGGLGEVGRQLGGVKAPSVGISQGGGIGAAARFGGSTNATTNPLKRILKK